MDSLELLLVMRCRSCGDHEGEDMMDQTDAAWPAMTARGDPGRFIVRAHGMREPAVAEGAEKEKE